MTIGSIQDIVALEGSNPDPFSGLASTYEMISAGAAIDPEAMALSFFLRTEDHDKPATWTHAQWLQDITRTANMLRRLGVEKDDVVAYVLPNLPEAHLAIWGGETAGIAFAVNALLEGDQMGELLAAAKTRWLITTGPSPDAELWKRVEDALASPASANLDLQGVLAVDATRHRPGSAKGSGSSQRIEDLPESLGWIPVFDFHLELAQESGDRLDFSPPAAQDIASYFCTGGTTGLPKIARHTHRNETANVVQLSAVLPELFRSGRTLLTALPLFHVNAQLGTGLAVFAAGGHALLGPPAGYRAPGLMERFWEIVAHHKVASFSGVPTVYAGLLQASTADHDLSCLYCAICGAAPMPVELLNSFERETGMRVLEGYGLTESSAVASVTPARGTARVGSIGLRLPWEEMRALILDEEGNYVRDADVDEVGVIGLRGEHVFAGYLTEAHNASAWIEMPDGQGSWLNTGDLARMDSEGFFWLTGRKKELIIRGGHNIDPKMIEEALAAHPAVAMSAAVGRPDAHAGEVPVAYVQLIQGSSVTEGELIAYARLEIPERAAVPKFLHVVEALPVTAVGKTFKPALVMNEVESVVRQEAGLASVELLDLQVEQDPKAGIVARYRVGHSDSGILTEVLARYVFSSEEQLSDG